MDTRKSAATIDEYIAACPAGVRTLLETLRATIRAAAPEAQERISYQIPTFYLDGNLVHFAAFKNHIGFYPTSSGIEAFRSELSAYPCARGTVRFPLDQPLPLPLIRRIVEFRVAESRRRAAETTRQRDG